MRKPGGRLSEARALATETSSDDRVPSPGHERRATHAAISQLRRQAAPPRCFRVPRDPAGIDGDKPFRATSAYTVAGETTMTAEFHVRQFVFRLVMWVNYHEDRRR